MELDHRDGRRPELRRATGAFAANCASVGLFMTARDAKRSA
jgi:hypothetical protein